MYFFYLDSVKTIFAQTAPGLPPEVWWVPALVLFVLGSAALIDTITSIIPDPLIFLGLLVVTLTQGLTVSWPDAAAHLAEALAVALGIWAINQAWYRLMKADALGMGDAKWTMLAVSCFGIIPALFAWGFGACLAVAWMGTARMAHYKITRVFFAPFLFIGLCAGLYWLRLR